MPLQVSTFYSALVKRRVHIGQHLGVPREDVRRYPHSVKQPGSLAGSVQSTLLPESSTFVRTNWRAKNTVFPCLGNWSGCSRPFLAPFTENGRNASKHSRNTRLHFRKVF